MATRKYCMKCNRGTCKRHNRTRSRSIPIILGKKLGGGCGCGGVLHGGYTYSKRTYTRHHTPTQQNSIKHVRTSTRKMKGGNGGCANGVGFGTSFSGMPISKFYPLNSFDSDPNYYSLDSRNIPL